MITVYKATKIITMDRNCPFATHVAVRDGRILAVGDENCAADWGEAEINDQFADRIMMPGLIEAHAHVSAGGIWRYTYCGHYPRTDPEGKVWDGLGDYDAVIARLRPVAESTPPGKPVIGWGVDPNIMPGRRLDRSHLDQVSENHPIILFHSNLHLLTANTRALQDADMLGSRNLEGIIRNESGEPTGELQEFIAMAPVMEFCDVRYSDFSDADSLRTYGKIARNCGVTTVADLLSDLDEAELKMVREVTAEPGFPVRYVPVMNAMEGTPDDEAERALSLRKYSTDKLYLGRAKLFTDGAIQGFTAKLNPPGYYKGEDHGIWNMDLDKFRASVIALHKAGVKTHTHTNGDLASQVAIEAYEAAMLESPNPDLRHTLEHVQLAGIEQFRRMKALGLTVNVFANHLHYFGDVHWTQSLGPDRARRMNACRDAATVFDGNFAIHSDAPVTPMSPLFTAWCAVNRQTQSGRILGDSQQISSEQALYAITMGAAHVLKLENLVGSISCGKFADFVLLDEDPLNVPPMELKDVPVHRTILSGEVVA